MSIHCITSCEQSSEPCLEMDMNDRFDLNIDLQRGSMIST